MTQGNDSYFETGYYDSPLGVLKYEVDKKGLRSLKMESPKNLKAALRRQARSTVAKNIVRQLEEYFSGKRKRFDLPLSPQGSDFDKKVWKQLQRIPYANTRTYSEIARLLNNPRAFRAVGTACGRNPYFLVVPCHRVVAKQGLGGFAYGSNTKWQLLQMEGRVKDDSY